MFSKKTFGHIDIQKSMHKFSLYLIHLENQTRRCDFVFIRKQHLKLTLMGVAF